MSEKIEKINFPFRKHLQNFIPYSSARDEFVSNGQKYTFLDANENPFENDEKNRYPEVMHDELREKIVEVKTSQFSCHLEKNNIILGNGSDELIDLLIRIFCEPKVDSICISSPTFGMYGVSANVNNVNVIDISLNSRTFELDDIVVDKILLSDNTCVTIENQNNIKLLFLCHPNNPTGNIISEKRLLKILDNFSGMVVVDEAYIDFSSEHSTLKFLQKYPKLIVLQTFSKMWGLAGVRCGKAFAHPDVITMLQAVKDPYNVNMLTARAVNDALNNKSTIYQKRNIILAQKLYLEDECKKLTISENPIFSEVYPSHCNSILVRLVPELDSDIMYEKLKNKGIVVRNFGKKQFLENCLRISVGTPEENFRVVEILRNI
ncbi:TPA: histidinol-phosphate transaminase [Candidatus Gracilibacteria bacterium]|nr:histidinol-phosphate transaminase [Candidatus Gracilibacteria bacterium]